MNIKERVTNLIKQFKYYNIEGYIIPSTDEYQSEYVPGYAKRLEYISGFTGSNGICIVLQNQGLFFTDGRYLEQSKLQLDSSFFRIFDIKDIINFPFNEYVNNDSTIGYDPQLFTKQNLKIFESLNLISLKENLCDSIWIDQPNQPNSKIYVYPDEYSGQSYEDKIKICRKLLSKHIAEALVITSPDSVCWLLNLRASDVEYSPLMLARAIIYTEKIYLFIDESRIDDELRKARSLIDFLPSKQFESFLKSIKGKTLIDENLASIMVNDSIQNKIFVPDPCKLLKACKNNIEIQHAINSHIEDGIAVCEFLSYLANCDLLLNEYDIGKSLTTYRAKRTGYVFDSFPTICGFKENGAIIHYKAEKNNAKKIQGNGLLLIDSGGQYLGCTTDITRTISYGTPTDEEKYYFTLVLKSNIELSKAKFPAGVSGANLEVLARKFLWNEGTDYPHSTGHGVGNYLSVHEGPQSISLRNTVPLQVGMILSNEPGYYVPGKFGIRIENLMYVKKSTSLNYMQFETLSLVPYAKELINFDMLNNDEKDYLKQYYQKIHKSLYHLLSQNAQIWLKSQIDI